jgi:hypothetical protein
MELEVARARCKDRLVWAIAQLAGKSDPIQIEKITELVIQTMTGLGAIFIPLNTSLRSVALLMPLKFWRLYFMTSSMCKSIMA